MKRTAKLALGMAAIAALATGARAADVAPIIVPSVPSAVQIPVETGFDWQGFYLGATHAAVFNLGAGDFGWYIPSLQAGYNITFGRLLLGAEAKVGAYIDPSIALTLQFDVRAGLALDRVAVYGLFGVINYGWPPVWYAVGGAGIEVAIGDRLSVFGEVRLEELFDPPFYLHAVVGVNWHLGN